MSVIQLGSAAAVGHFHVCFGYNFWSLRPVLLEMSKSVAVQSQHIAFLYFTSGSILKYFFSVILTPYCCISPFA